MNTDDPKNPSDLKTPPPPRGKSINQPIMMIADFREKAILLGSTPKANSPPDEGGHAEEK